MPKALGAVTGACLLAACLTIGALAADTGGPVKLLLAIYGEQNTGEFAYPAAVGVGERLTVADTGNRRLLFFDPQGDLFKYAGRFDAGGKLGAPFCVAELSGGRLLVAERGKAALTLCDPKTNTAASAQLEGVPQAGRLVPGRFCAGSDGRLYLIDNGLSRILVLSAELRFEREVTLAEEGFGGFSDVRVDRRGNLYALETLRGLVHVFDPQLKRVRSFGSRAAEGEGAALFEFPVSLALDRQGNVYVLDSHRAQLIVCDPEGRLQWRLGGFGWKEGSFNGPSYVAIDGLNRIFVADRLNNRIQVFAPLRPM
jgi:DNA-binding beta-propeller fold protein YncE